MTAYQQRQLDVLGDTTRRAIVELLRRGPTPVGELARAVPVSRPAVSQHLRVLQKAHLVRHRAVGTRHIYELDSKGFTALRAYFETFWGDALEAMKTKVEKNEDE
jgi:DNA-binding transcriptional ArsR family regulator